MPAMKFCLLITPFNERPDFQKNHLIHRNWMKIRENCMKFQEEFDGNHLGAQKEVKNQFLIKPPHSYPRMGGGW